MSDRIRGVLAPVVTPFKSDLSVDSQRLVEHCRWLVSQNCGLAVFGTNSEGNSLAVDERSDLLDELVAAGIDPARMMPGTGCCALTDTVRLTAQAVKHGCAGVLMLPPFYYKGVSEEGLFRYFSEVVQRVGDARLRIYLYHIPPVAMVGITTGLVERLLKAYPNAIAGMKDSSGDWNNTQTFLDAFCASRAGDTGFDVFVGSESFLLANMRNGGAGCISATANVNPAAIHKLYADCEELDRVNGINTLGSGPQRIKDKPRMDTNLHESADRGLELEGLQAELDVVREVFAKTGNMIAALKLGIAISRNDPAWAKVRPPLVELTAEQAKALAAELRGVGFTMAGV